MRVIIAGGGTGGHVFPALAIKQAIVQAAPDAQVIFAGTAQGLEARVMPREHETLKKIWISGFSRRHMLRNVALPLKLGVSFTQSFALLKKFKPHVVIGTGGYVMGPVLWTAQRLGIPTVLQEQNSFPGYTTRQLAEKASVVCVGFEDAVKRLPETANVVVTGNPLRASFHTIDRETARRNWPLDPARKTLLIFGGSAGAKSINDAAGGAIELLARGYNVIWQTGKLGVPAAVNSKVIESATRAGTLQVLEFIDDMPGAYAMADLAICRAGAMTLAELSMAGVPAILVPYPYATDDHQTANANAMVDHGAAEVINDFELTPAALLAAIARCTAPASTLVTMALAMRHLARPGAAAEIAKIALSFA